LLPSVPLYQLPKLHQMLNQVGFSQGVRFTKGYRALIADIIARPTSSQPPSL